jgi:hypothetical protein
VVNFEVSSHCALIRHVCIMCVRFLSLMPQIALVPCLAHFSPLSFLSPALLIRHRTCWHAYFGCQFPSNLRIPLARPRMRAVERRPCSVQKFRHNVRCVHYNTSPILKPIFYLNTSFLRNIRVFCHYSSYSLPFLISITPLR